MRKPLLSSLFAVAILIVSSACDSGPTNPAIVDVTVPGTFELQLLQPTETPFTGTAEFAHCDGLGYRWLRLRSASWPGEDVRMQPSLGVPQAIIPIPTGTHTFNELGRGSQFWDLNHTRRGSTGVAVEFGLPFSGRIEITESTSGSLRGRIDLMLTFYRDSVTPPLSRRLRGSFWALADPLCEGFPW